MDMPFAEIAVVVGAPEPTVKSRMRYALERLREALDDLRGGAPLRATGPGGAQ
jgi:RNA polymerase sigma-70 factor (ECF subfamily)